jgi:hypothetical protein
VERARAARVEREREAMVARERKAMVEREGEAVVDLMLPGEVDTLAAACTSQEGREAVTVEQVEGRFSV